MLKTHRWLFLAGLALALPHLQGAGCRTHYSARVHGQLVPDGGFVSEHAGAPIRVIYRTRESDTPVCSEDWVPCLQSSLWRPLRPCDPDQGNGAVISVSAGQASYAFDACTDMVGVDYIADVAAFIDVDRDGRLGAGEPYGVYEGNPLSRGAEDSALPLAIRIDRRMP